MGRWFSRSAAALALTASGAMVATPALATETYIPVTMNSASAHVAAAPGIASANWGWRGGWGGGWRHDDGGDVLAGVLILGGIAAVAAAAASANHDRRGYDYPPPPPPPPPQYRGDYYPQPNYRDAPPPREYRAPNGNYGRSDVRPGYGGVGNGSDVAQQVCAQEIERDGRRIDNIDSIDRDADGWSVAGRLRDGREFSCNIGRDGRPESVTVEGHPA